MIDEILGYKTKPDELVMSAREKEAEWWGYEKCPHCGLYGAGDVEYCLCGYKFTNF